MHHPPKPRSDSLLGGRSSVVTLYTTLAVFALLFMYSRSVTMYGAPQLRRLAPAHNSRARLKLVQVVFRHGSRTPLNRAYTFHETWDVCPKQYEGFDVERVDSGGAAEPPPLVDRNASVMPGAGGCKMGQLTSTGYSQAAKLGNWLKQRYTQEFSLLPQHYQPGSIFCWTTSFSRTIHTLGGVLLGLYPKAAAEGTTITAVSAVPSKEIMYGINDTCPRLGPMIESRRLEYEKWEVGDKEVRKQAAAVKRALGFGPKQGVAWSPLFDTIAAMKAVGKTVEGLSDDIWKIIVTRAIQREEAIIAPCNGDMSDCRQALQLYLGRLADQLLGNLNKASKCPAPPPGAPPSRKPCIASPLMLYSGHDSTIIPLMAILGHPLDTWPDFASNVVLELWQYTSQRHTVSHYVRVLYNGQHLQLRKSTALGSLVPYSEFVERLRLFAVNEKQHKEMCAIPPAKHG